MIYELFNTETRHIEAVQDIPAPEAHSRNVALMERGDPRRWVEAGSNEENRKEANGSGSIDVGLRS